MENLKNLTELYIHYPKYQTQPKEIHNSTSGSHKIPIEYAHLIKEYDKWTKEQPLQL